MSKRKADISKVASSGSGSSAGGPVMPAKSHEHCRTVENGTRRTLMGPEPVIYCLDHHEHLYPRVIYRR